MFVTQKQLDVIVHISHTCMNVLNSKRVIMRSRAETDVLIFINKINKPKLRWRLAEYSGSSGENVNFHI